MKSIVICGAGQIGQAVHLLVKRLQLDNCEVHLWDSELKPSVTQKVDFEPSTPRMIEMYLEEVQATHIINCLPFHLNIKIAVAAAKRKIVYIDFTEDDVQAEAVEALYRSEGLTCAVKCGLAPGFINYVGYDRVKQLDTCSKLLLSVGALPRSINYINPLDSYSTSWSVDGLVNEYLRPCKIKLNGRTYSVPALTHQEKVLIDGCEYEAAFTSGGVGSLVTDLKDVPTVYYKTLRYPGHWDAVRALVASTDGSFEQVKARFDQELSFCQDDMVVVYAEAQGTKNGRKTRSIFSARYIGSDLTAIQSTTAGSGVAVLELILQGKLSGVVKHTDVNLHDLINTTTFSATYRRL